MNKLSEYIPFIAMSSLFVFLIVFHVASNPKEIRLRTGDELELVDVQVSTAEFYKNCKIKFIAAHRLKEHIDVFVEISECDFQKIGYAWATDPMTEVFPLQNLRKK